MFAMLFPTRIVVKISLGLSVVKIRAFAFRPPSLISCLVRSRLIEISAASEPEKKDEVKKQTIRAKISLVLIAN
jgi:hypothetical protein